MNIKLLLCIPFAITVLSVTEKVGSDDIASIIITLLFVIYCLYVLASTAFEKEKGKES